MEAVFFNLIFDNILIRIKIIESCKFNNNWKRFVQKMIMNLDEVKELFKYFIPFIKSTLL